MAIINRMEYALKHIIMFDSERGVRVAVFEVVCCFLFAS